MSKHLPVAVQVYGLRDLLENSPQNFKSVMQQVKDLGYDGVELAGTYGLEPAFIKKYTDRIPVVHLKDYIKKGEVKNMYKLIGIDTEESEGDTGYFGFRPVGFGQMIWEPVLEAALEANAQWVVVEQDEHYELDPMECARRSREYLKILGW